MGAGMSFMIHALFFFVGGAMFVHAAEYGVDLGSGMEVSLIAAPAAPVVEQAPEPMAQEDTVAFQRQIETMPLPEAPKLAPVAPEPPKLTGDGSSLIPGKDATTFYSSAGAVTQAKPKYMRNPAPSYPEEARKKREEGVVLLSVQVGASGQAKEVNIKNGSGFQALDESALKTVRRWRFEPAKIGSLKVESRVEIPIRFQLEGNQ